MAVFGKLIYPSMIAYVKNFGIVGLFLNGDVDWIRKETTLTYFSGTTEAFARFSWRMSTSEGCNKDVLSVVHL
jgi:hypothetical protein